MDTHELIQLLTAFEQAHGSLAVLIDDGASNPAVIENARVSTQDGKSVVLLDLL